jgi:predicted transposase/invertase (TIGR01784 family)
MALEIEDRKTSLFKEGKKEGRQEERLQMAHRLLKEGVKPEIIAKASGLPLAEVKKLSNN